MKIAWTHHGPPRAKSIAVPPTPSLIDWYALDYDGDREEVIYVCRPDDDKRGGEIHAFDGTTWNVVTKRRFEFEDNIEGAGWDASRHGVVVWMFAHDYEAKRERAFGTLVTADGAKKLATHGDEPRDVPEGSEDGVGTFDKHGLFAFDRARSVWVCVTRAGVWELDASGAWTKKHDGKLVPASWHNKSGNGVYDPVGKRTVFIVQGEENKYAIVLLAWDGAKLERLSMKGLPKMMIGLFDPIVQLAGHGKHGLVMHAGGGKLFGVTASGWEPLAPTANPPPNMEDACLAWDEKRDLLVLGPGKHEGAGGSDRNDVFFVLRNGTWEQQGVAIVHSPIKSASYGKVELAHVGGVWHALGSHSLRAWRFTNDTWKEFTDDTVGNGKLGGWERVQLVAARERLHAIMQSGAVFALEGDTWKTIVKKDPAFKKRMDWAHAADPNGRIVAWGGEANGRKLNDTLFLEDKKWRVAKKPSPQPADFKHGRKDNVYVDVLLVWDTALGAFVRFGFEEVAILQADETWKAHKPKGYKANVSERAHGHFPVHDAQTGETLVVDFAGLESWQSKGRPARVSRFDLAECTPLATLEFPAELAKKRQSDAAAYHTLAESFSWDATTRSLYAQALEDAAGTYRLDLGPLFDKAKTMGARTIPKGGAAKADVTKLYRVRAGKAESILSTAKVTKGYVRASMLSREALVELVGVESREITVGKVAKGKAPASRLGGEPSGVTPATWPRIKKRPMGFLFQIATGKLLKKHAGVAVFCALDGEATNEEDDNAVVLLSAADFKKTCTTPEGVPALPMRALDVAEPRIEIDEERAQAIAAKDVELGAAFERLQTMKGMQDHNLADKLGGLPQFLQDEAQIKRHKFVGQLDFDSIDTSKAWPDAGLMGCVYVFVSDDEKSGFAFWQYT
jgi:hypothetical protein